MKFEVFKNLEETATDYRAVFLAIQTANREGNDITSSVAARITAERRQAETRATELGATIRDATRSETIRKMAALELERLNGQTYGPTDIEREAFDDAISELEQAAADAKTLQAKLTGLLKEARDELEEIRKTTIHNTGNNLEICAGWPTGLRRDFAAMLARVGAEVQK